VVECVPAFDPEADAHASGPVDAWLDALIDGKAEAIEIGGDTKLAARLLRRLHKTLFHRLKPLRFRG